MLRIVSSKKGFNLVFWVIALFIAGPVLYGMVTFKVIEFSAQSHPWWVYPLSVLAILVGVRLLLDRLFGKGGKG